MTNNFFFLLAKPFIHHISGVLLALLIFNLLYYLLSKRIKKTKDLKILIIAGAIFLGIYLRLCLAYFSIGNNDINAYKYIVSLVLEGKNVYAVTHRYNYSPLWFLILAFLFKLNALIPSLPFHFIVKSFFTLVDLFSLFVLFKISRLKKIPFDRVAVAFFLNPVSVLITGHHGQFENISILFILLGIYILLSFKNKIIAWFCFLAGGIVKHIVFNQVLAFIRFWLKHKRKILIYFGISVFIFLSTFAPFWGQGKEGIIKNVFLYRSQEGKYGIMYFINKIKLISGFNSYYRYLFIFLYFWFAFKFKTKNIIKTVLINNLFFLSFTSGMADQYLVLPLAIASISSLRWLTIYTIFASLYLFKSSAQLGLTKYNFISNTVLWLIILIWFFVEYFKSYESKN